MWCSFWANPGSHAGNKLPTKQRLELIAKSVTPQLDFRCSLWPQRTIAKEVDNLQRKMVSCVLRPARFPGEDIADFVRRRGRLAANQCRLSGVWSKRWFRRACDWHDHLLRPRNLNCWASKLLRYHDRNWLIQRRSDLLPSDSRVGSSLAGRTNTRIGPGKVHVRWEDGIIFTRGH